MNATLNRRAATVALLILSVTGLLPQRAAASGLLIPTEERVAPLRITDHHVTVEITDRVALTTVNQTFQNMTNRRLEATYIFPIPEGADLTDFQMTFNGRMVQGEVLPADKARQIYESIVRRQEDPGLIEFIGRRLLRARIFPIEPNSKTEIQLSYQQVTDPVSEMWRYVYPLRTPGHNSRAHGTVRFDVNLKTASPLRAVWSPTHEVEIVRDGEHRAKVGFERSNYRLDEDFILLYDAADRDIGLSVVAHREDPDKPGHFVLLLSPKQLWEEAQPVPQDYVFVIDTSGSMAANSKMEQVKQALRYCVERLEPHDRFSIVRFSTGFDLVFNELRPADAEATKEAIEVISQYRARGGTNIHDAMQAAVRLRDESEPDRPFVIIFLTDGIGQTPREHDEAMLTRETKGFRDRVRLFPFGVGYDVNTVYLDALALNWNGTPTYVRPEENLELVLGDFFSIFSEPVLTDLRLTLPEIAVTEMFPPVLGDLYHGRQLFIAGRFDKPLTGPVTLRGKRGNTEVEYVWPAVHFEPHDEATYVPRLWAGRKIAFLLDRIRLDGETQEMIDEVLELSIRYGIQTPYSSWLVAPEQRGRLASRGIRETDRRSDGAFERAARPASPAAAAARRYGGHEGVAESDQMEDLDEADVQLLAAQVRARSEISGDAAVQAAAWQAAQRGGFSGAAARSSVADALAVRQIGQQRFFNISGYLVDEAFGEKAEIIEVKFASPAYFELIEARADLRLALAASRHVIVILDDSTAVVVRTSAGQEEFTAEQQRRLRRG